MDGPGHEGCRRSRTPAKPGPAADGDHVGLVRNRWDLHGPEHGFSSKAGGSAVPKAARIAVNMAVSNPGGGSARCSALPMATTMARKIIPEMTDGYFFNPGEEEILPDREFVPPRME